MISEYALIYMNLSECARILILPEFVNMYLNMGKKTSKCLKLLILLNMSET